MNNKKMRANVVNYRGRMINGEANPIDVYVGNRLRLRREMLKIPQAKLASLLGVTSQQIQKYEKGINRIGASRIWDMTLVLNVPVSYFYEGIDEKIDKYSPRRLYGKDETVLINTETDPLFNKSNIELIMALEKIKNCKLQQSIRNLIISLSKTTSYNLSKDLGKNTD